MKKELIKLGILSFLLGAILGWLIMSRVYGSYEEPTIYPLENISPTLSCTPTPSPALLVTPGLTPTPGTQIGTPASADNTAGSSAMVIAPTFAPATGKAK